MCARRLALMSQVFVATTTTHSIRNATYFYKNTLKKPITCFLIRQIVSVLLSFFTIHYFNLEGREERIVETKPINDFVYITQCFLSQNVHLMTFLFFVFLFLNHVSCFTIRIRNITKNE